MKLAGGKVFTIKLVERETVGNKRGLKSYG